MCTFTNLNSVIKCLVGFFVNKTIPILIGFAVIVFLWGIVIFIKDGGDESKREEGKQFMFWGVIGISFILCIWSFVAILSGTFGESTPFIPQIKSIK